MLSKQTYELVATAINETEAALLTKLGRQAGQKALFQLACRLVEEFKADNPRFHQEKFMQASFGDDWRELYEL